MIEITFLSKDTIGIIATSFYQVDHARCITIYFFALGTTWRYKKKLKQFWIIFFEKSQPPPFPVKWSVPNTSVTTTKQDISHTTLETQNQQVYPQSKEIYCNTPSMVYLVKTGGYVKKKYYDPIVACKI
jgi:hypothetical protein